MKPTDERSAALTTIREREAEAVAALQDAAGDRSLCALSRSGQPHPAAKFHEGAVAALAQTRRAVSRLGPDARLADAVARLRERWRSRVGSAVSAGRDWQAYYTGGIEALDALVAALRSDRSDQPWSGR